MRLTFFCFSLLGLMCLGCTKVQSSNAPAHQSGDDALRAFFDLRSTGKTITDIERDVFYVHAIARLEKGRLVGLDKVSNGMINARQPEAIFEIVWGKKSDQYGYSFVSNETRYGFEPAPFFEHLVNGGSGWCALETIRQRTVEFKGMKVLAFAVSSYPKDPTELVNPNPRTKIEASLKDVDYAVLILFKECSSIKASLDFLHDLKKQRSENEPSPSRTSRVPAHGENTALSPPAAKCGSRRLSG